MKTKNIFILVSLILISVSVHAQQIQKVPKFKPPVVNTYLGIRQNGDSVVTEEAVQLVGLPLKVTDKEKNVYKVDTYQFAYKKKSAVENEETGKIHTTFTLSAARFDHSPLPDVWIKNIQNGLKRDEELYFFDILVEDNQGRKFFAPEIKITVK